MERVATPERLRLFVAVDLPPEHLERLEAAIASLKDTFEGGRWTPVENQHVTLKFLGSVASDRLDEISDACAGVARTSEPAPLSLEGLGTFPGGKRMRVLWVGLLDRRGLLTKLAAELDRAFEPLGFEPEKRAFTPHLTLARFKTPRRLEGPLPEVVLPSDSFELNDLVLYRSHLSPRGARYSALERWPFGSGRTEAGGVETLT